MKKFAAIALGCLIVVTLTMVQNAIAKKPATYEFDGTVSLKTIFSRGKYLGELRVVQPDGKTITFSIPKTTKFYDTDGTEIKFCDIMAGDRVKVKYRVKKPEGRKRYETIEVRRGPM